MGKAVDDQPDADKWLSLHFCKKLCHRPGECEDVAIEGNRCGQSCGKTKMFCEHKCQNPCHGQTRKYIDSPVGSEPALTGDSM